MSDHRALILDEVRKYHAEQAGGGSPFTPGVTEIWPSGAVLDESDRLALVEAALDLRIAAGGIARRFESSFARLLKQRKAHLTNSGSSADLLALTALTSPLLKDERLRPGDEVVTVAADFPTTVNPILQNGMVPVFVDIDIDIPTYNATAERVAEAIGPKTRAIMMAHTLGKPYEARGIAELAAEHGLFLVEDNCDAVGSTYDGRPAGSFGDLSTVSFYPAHHVTVGEGSCVLTSTPLLARIVESLRDWGRDCGCEPGEDLVLDAGTAAGRGRIRYDALHSEEGGRFLNATSRYLVVDTDEVPADPPRSYRWVTPDQLSTLAGHRHYVNVQARTLLACLNAMGPAG
ncbi:DegT/DnrJ/EryC1/StrS family aminotransferase [Streptomyces sp. NPDC059752]|uniref:DegT/DnrJ/EryC1/StrS family aminotransferase n=1 Tax=unclassified Streptomyces TaxID=2593676 RepID=UPI0036610FB0